MTKNESAKYQQLARVPAQKFEQAITKMQKGEIPATEAAPYNNLC